MTIALLHHLHTLSPRLAEVVEGEMARELNDLTARDTAYWIAFQKRIEALKPKRGPAVRRTLGVE